jgi:hypothetical protein
MDQKLWVFEVFIWAGQACAGANENELTTCGKNWGQKRGKGGGNYRKKGHAVLVLPI